MSVQAMEWAFRQRTRSSGQRLVLWALANRAGEDGQCWPSVDDTSDRTQIKDRQVRAHMDTLVDDGLLVKVARRHRNDGTLGTWWLWLPIGERPEELPDGKPFPDADRQSTATGSPPPHQTGSPPPVVHRQSTAAHEQSFQNSHLEQSENPLPPSAELVPSGAVSQGDSSFEEAMTQFWAAYPRKLGRPAAVKALRAALKASPPGVIGQGLTAWIDHWRAAGTDPTFIPHPATWLNRHQFNDEPPPIAPSKADTSMAGRLARVNQLVEQGWTLEDARRKVGWQS